MKPRNKLQREVLQLSQELPKITAGQEDYAFKHCFKHLGYRLKSGVTCMECGARFQCSGKEYVCTECDTHLKIEDTRKLKHSATSYFAILTTQREFQVIRFFEVLQWLKKGEKVHYAIHEVVQRYFTVDGKDTIVSVPCSYGGSFTWGNLEIKNPSTSYYSYASPWVKYDIYPTAIYPKKQVLPVFRRNGYRNSFHGISPFDLLRVLLKESRIETLFKAKQYAIIRHSLRSFSSANYSLNNYWDSLKICMRNKYIVKDASLWQDYIDLLLYFCKDVRNAKYVCPENLLRVHDILMVKKERIEEIERRERARLNGIKDKKQRQKEIRDFKKLKGRFFGISFSDNTITVVVLNSIKEYIKESKMLSHCLYTNRYHSKPGTLILSARVNDERIATIEVSLETFKVMQCRGINNSKPKQYEKILALVNKNIKLLKKAA